MLYACETDKSSDDFNTVTGIVVENKLQKGVLGFKNLSKRPWKVKMPDGNFYSVDPERGFPIWAGLVIDFGGVTATIE
jgi:hypothetical protein